MRTRPTSPWHTLVAGLCAPWTIVALAPLPAASAGQVPVVRTIAMQNDPAPGMSGQAFASFSPPAINSAGRVVFCAKTYTSGQSSSVVTGSGIWTDAGGTLALVARSGAGAPGGGTFPADMTQASVNIADSGTVAFWTVLSDVSYGIYSLTGGALGQVARTGQTTTIPPATPGKYDSLSLDFALTPDGRVVFVGNVIPTNPAPEDALGYHGLFVASPAGGVLAQRGRFDIPNSAFVASPDIGALTNASGSLACVGYDGKPTGQFPPLAIIAGTSGGMGVVARMDPVIGTPATGFPAGTRIASVGGLLGLNNASTIGFTGLTTLGSGVTEANQRGLWTLKNGTLTLVTRSGQQVPDLPAGVTLKLQLDPSFATAGAPAISDNTDAVFFSLLGSADPAYADKLAVFRAVPGQPVRTLLRAGQGVPGGLPGETIAQLVYSDPAVVNASGQVLLNVFTSATRIIPYALEPGGTVHKLWDPTSELLTIRNAQPALLVLASSSPFGSGGSDGRARVLNNAGEAASVMTAVIPGAPATLTGVFVFSLNATVPSPSACNAADIADGSGAGGSDKKLTAADVVAFFSDFFASCLPGTKPCTRADVTDNAGTGPPDGLLTGADVVTFFTALFAGCP